MASKEIVIPPDQPKTPPILPKDQTPPKQRPERSPSPEENCSICLNEFENKSFTDSCFHKFCFVCILEWSKVKAVCPLCKTSFKSIIHNIVSNEIYDQYHLQPNNPTPATDDQDGRRFRYRTTLTDDHRYAWEHNHNAFLRISHEERRRYREQRLQNQRNAAYNYRRYIYALGLRVKQTRWNRFSGYRDISLEFFRRNPATVYRLVPWLQRDLSVIFNGDQNNVLFITELILSLIQRVDIQSPEFRNNLEGFLLNKTDHFVHEFISFARSPYNVDMYDQMVEYYATPTEPFIDINQPLLVISSESDTDTDVILDLSAHSREELNLPTHNPFPPLELDLNVAPGTSRESSNTHNQVVKQEKNDNTEIDVTNAQSDVEIVGYLKPYHERTPEIVVLSSDTEEQEQPTCRKCGQPKHASKCKKIKRKPKTSAKASYESYRLSRSPQDYRSSSHPRSRSPSRRHDRSSRSSSMSPPRSKSITKRRTSKYNWFKSSSSSGNYSSDTEDNSKNHQKSKLESSKLFEKYQKHYKSSYNRSVRSPSRSYKHQSRSHSSRSRSVGYRSRSRSHSRSRSASRSRSPSHSLTHSKPHRSPTRSPTRSYTSTSRSQSRSKNTLHESHTSKSKSRSRDRESSRLDRHDKSYFKSKNSDGKSSRDKESQKRHKLSSKSYLKSRYYRSSSRSKSNKRRHQSLRRSRSSDEADSTTNSNSLKRRSKERQEARRKRREKRRQDRRKKATDNSKKLVCIDLTQSADEKVNTRNVPGPTSPALIFEEEVLTLNQSESDTFLGQTSGVGPMRAMLPDDIPRITAIPSSNVVDQIPLLNVVNEIPSLNVVNEIPSLNIVNEIPSLNVLNGIPSFSVVNEISSLNVVNEIPSLNVVNELDRRDPQPRGSVRKTALDLLIEAEKVRLQEMMHKNDGNFRRDNGWNS